MAGGGDATAEAGDLTVVVNAVARSGQFEPFDSGVVQSGCFHVHTVST